METLEIKTTPFLRYLHVSVSIAELDMKCNYFLKKFHPEEEQSLLIAYPSIQLILQEKVVLPEKIIGLLDVKHVVRDIYTRDLENHKTEDNASRPLIKVAKMRNGRQKVSLQTRDTNEMNSQDTELIEFECSSDEFISRVDLLLELFALNQFKTKIERLRRIKEEIAKNDIAGGRKSKKRKLTIDQTTLRSGKPFKKINYDGATVALDEMEREVGQQSKKRKTFIGQTTLRSGKCFHPFTQRAHSEDSMDLDEMEEEVLADTIRSGDALFRRRGYTTVTPEKSQRLKDEVTDEIFSIDKRIRGCGYRSRILNIFVNEQDVRKQLLITKDIETTMEKHNIVGYRVLFGIHEIQLSSGYLAGCEVLNEVGLSGTLGGYTRGNQKTYGILARHFAEPDRGTDFQRRLCLYCRVQNNLQRKIGDVVKCNGKYDISAAKMIVTPPEPRFRNLAGEHVPSRVFLFDEGNQEERPLYTWTSGKTHPRKGKIAIPFYKYRDLPGHYILIEDTSELDRETNTFRWKRFCKRGHSGAIFCSDEPDGKCARVFSMLQGMQNYTEADANPKKKGLYLSFALHEGLEQLRAEIGEQLELC